tara:strand:+ start:1233 stop:1418 length:186 start_codon:yes stop_codon:yes gene_type:complete
MSKVISSFLLGCVLVLAGCGSQETTKDITPMIMPQTEQQSIPIETQDLIWPVTPYDITKVA